MTEDRLFNLLVARTQTRETSTLAITIIAASASLILLGFVCQVNEEQRTPLVIIGILYPILGIIFREYTYGTVQSRDYDRIIRYFRGDEVNDVRIGYATWPRRVIFYLLFAVLPVAAWIFISTTEIC